MENNNSNKNTGGITFMGGLQLALIILKFLNVIHKPWWVVLLPLEIEIVLIIIIVIISLKE